MTDTGLMETKVTYEVNSEQITLTGNMIKRFLVSGDPNKVSEQEITMFLNLCKYQKLNPFLNEAYLVKFGTQAAQIIVSKEAFMKRAESNEHYQGFKAGIVVQRGEKLEKIEGALKLNKDVLIGGWAEVYRDDRNHPITIELSLQEFGKSQATWKSMPMNMIRKTAIVNALREAFPENLGAMYTEDDKGPHENSVAPNSEVLDPEVIDVEEVTPTEEVAKSQEQHEEQSNKSESAKDPF